MTTESDLAARLERWVDRGLITPDQAERIRDDERANPAQRHGPSLVAEALGYVGGVLVLVAAATITGRFWSDLGTGGRLVVAFVAAAVLLAAGAAAPARLGRASGRLRSVTWLLSAAVLGGALALVGDDVLDAPGDLVVFGSAGLTAVYAGVLWYVHRWLLQQVALVAALAMAAGGAGRCSRATARTSSGWPSGVSAWPGRCSGGATSWPPAPSPTSAAA